MGIRSSSDADMRTFMQCRGVRGRLQSRAHCDRRLESMLDALQDKSKVQVRWQMPEWASVA
jgi:hypothetical protein